MQKQQSTAVIMKDHESESTKEALQPEDYYPTLAIRGSIDSWFALRSLIEMSKREM